jgi:hypothetical protein
LNTTPAVFLLIILTQLGFGQETLKLLNSSYSREDAQSSFYKFLTSDNTDLKKFRMAFTFIDILSWLKQKANLS